MKCCVILFCALATASAIKPESVEKIKGRAVKYSNECKSELELADDDVAPILANHEPTTDKGKCFIACMNKKMGLQDANGKISKEGAYAAIEDFKEDDEDFYEKGKTVADTCLTEVSDSSDECETAFKLMLCVNHQKAAVGIDPITIST